MKKVKKILVFFSIGFISILLITGVALYISLNKKKPIGDNTVEADVVASKMLQNLDFGSYQDTKFISWKFSNHSYLWHKQRRRVKVSWDDHEVILDFDDPSKNKVKDDVNDEEKKSLIAKAERYFNNDSFWLIAPYKILDEGTKRSLVTLENNQIGLMVEYTSGGTTPGDTYLWKLDSAYRPVSFQMWVSILPIGGLEASWNNWKTTQSGAILAQEHSLLGFGIPISEIKAWN